MYSHTLTYQNNIYFRYILFILRHLLVMASMYTCIKFMPIYMFCFYFFLLNIKSKAFFTLIFKLFTLIYANAYMILHKLYYMSNVISVEIILFLDWLLSLCNI